MGETYSCQSGGRIDAGRHTGGPIGTAIAGMAAGDWLEYTGTNINDKETSGPNGTPRSYLEGEVLYPLTNWPGKIAYDPQTHIISVIGTTNGHTSDNPPGAFTKNVIFDTAANAFTALWNPIGWSYAHIYDTNASRPLGGYLYARGYGDPTIRRMNCATREWSNSAFSLTGISPAAAIVGALDVHPDLGSSGSILWLEYSTARLIRWNVADGARTVLGTFAGIGSYPVMHYVPGLRSVIFGGGTAGSAFYQLAEDGTITQLPTTPPVQIACDGVGGPFVPDPAGRARSYHFFHGDGTARCVDWVTGEWATLPPPPAGIADRFHVTVAASLQGQSAIALWAYGGRDGSGNTTSKFWLLKV